MVALRKVGLSHSAIAAMLQLDRGDDISGEQVRYALRRYAPELYVSGRWNAPHRMSGGPSKVKS